MLCPPALKVQAAVRVFGIQGVAERINAQIWESQREPKALLRSGEVSPDDGADHRAPEHVLLVEACLIGYAAGTLMLDIIFRALHDVKRWLAVKLQVLEHGRAGLWGCSGHGETTGVGPGAHLA